MLDPENGKIALSESRKTETGNRDKFYENLYGLQNSDQFKDSADKVQLTLLSDLSPGAIISKIESNDQGGLATRFALLALNPLFWKEKKLITVLSIPTANWISSVRIVARAR
ncbi:MAG: hypothetical protein HRU78_07155 [Gammaproteobacteria bacterium]|nr:MAG: hypothetical protein HRU78_07155 [Gammaproteobacteria bacterium]